MANEAVIVELLGDRGDVVSYACADGATIEKGTICILQDNRTASGAIALQTATSIAGIAAHEKVSGDGATTIGCYTNGIFDLYTASGGTITAGTYVCLSGANAIRQSALLGDFSGGLIFGRALETGSVNEVIQVRVIL